MVRQTQAIFAACVLLSLCTFIVAQESDNSKPMPITGRAVDTKGQPIADAEIFLTRLSPQRAAASTKTDSNGRYEFKDIEPAQGQFEVFGMAKGFGFTWYPHSVSFSNRDKLETDLKFEPPAKLRGRVVDGDGKPISLVKIGLWNAEPTPAKGYDDRRAFLRVQSSGFESLYVDHIIPGELRNRWTDEDGYFEFDALPPNCEFRIKATPPKGFASRMFYAATSAPQQFRFEDPKVHANGMVLEFLKNDVVPVQVVYDDTGLPAENVYVGAYNAQGTCWRVTDKFGFVALELPPDDYHMSILSAHKTPYASIKDREKKTTLSAKLKAPHLIRLKRAAEVEVEVVDEVTGRPVKGFDICFIKDDSRKEYMWRSWKMPRTSMVERPKTGKDGKMLVYLKPGEHEIAIGFREQPAGYRIKTRSMKIDCKPGKLQKLKFLVKGNTL